MTDEVLSRASIDVEVQLADVRRQLDSVKRMVSSATNDAGTVGGQSLASRMSSGLGRGLGAIGRTTAKFGKYAAVGIGLLGGAAIKTGIETAAGMEQAQIGFTTMLGSAKRARTFLGELEDFAASTPFEFPDLVSASQKLLAMGFSAKDVRPTLTAVGDAVAGLGGGAAEIDQVTRAMGQIQAKGKASAEELLQLTEAGIPAWDMLADKIGVSVPKAMDMVSKGTVDAETTIGALVAGMNKKFGGLMANQAKTVTGRFSTLKDTVTMGLADVVKPWMPTLKQGLKGLTGTAGPFLEDLAAKSARLSKAVKAAFEYGPIKAFKHALEGGALFEDMTGADQVFYKIGSAVRVVAQNVKALVSGDTGALKTQFSSIGASVVALVPLFKQFAAQMPSLTDALSLTATVLRFLADHTDLLAKLMPVLVGGFIAYKVAVLAANAAQAASVPLRLLEWRTNKALAASVRELTLAQRTATSSSVQSTTATTASTTSKIRDRVATIGKAVAEKAAAAGSKALAAAQWLVNAALSANPIGIIIVLIAALVAGLVYAWKHSETFRKIVTGAWEGIKTAALAVFGWLKPYISKIFAGIKFVVSDVLGNLKDIFGGALDVIVGIFTGDFGRAKDGAIRMLKGLLGYVSTIPRMILSALGKLGDLLFPAGMDVIRGMIGGIKDMAGKVVGAIKNVVGGAVDKAKDFLGIGSPSRVFMSIGTDTGEGLVRGLRAQRRRVAGAGGGLAAAAMPGRMRMTVPRLNGSPTAALSPAGLRVVAAGASTPGAGGDTHNWNVAEVRAHDYRDFVGQMQRRNRHKAAGGASFGR